MYSNEVYAISHAIQQSTQFIITESVFESLRKFDAIVDYSISVDLNFIQHALELQKLKGFEGINGERMLQNPVINVSVTPIHAIEHIDIVMSF